MIENKQLYSFEDEHDQGMDGSESAYPGEAGENSHSSSDGDASENPERFPSKVLFQAIISLFFIVSILLIAKSPFHGLRWARERIHHAIHASTEETFGYIAESKFVQAIIKNSQNLIKLEEITKQFTTYQPSLEEKNIFQGWVWPVKGQITKGFGWDSEFFGSIKEFNPGVQLTAPSGSHVASIATGQVSEIAKGNENDWYIEISHGNGWKSIYRNLDQVFVRVGQEIKGGEVIAQLTANAENGKALFNFELKKNDQAVDPLAVLVNN